MVCLYIAVAMISVGACILCTPVPYVLHSVVCTAVCCCVACRTQPSSVPMLRFVQTHGNVRVYQWRTGTAPEVTEEQSIRIDLSDEQDLASQSQDVSILPGFQ